MFVFERHKLRLWQLIVFRWELLFRLLIFESVKETCLCWSFSLDQSHWARWHIPIYRRDYTGPTYSRGQISACNLSYWLACSHWLILIWGRRKTFLFSKTSLSVRFRLELLPNLLAIWRLRRHNFLEFPCSVTLNLWRHYLPDLIICAWIDALIQRRGIPWLHKVILSSFHIFGGSLVSMLLGTFAEPWNSVRYQRGLLASLEIQCVGLFAVPVHVKRTAFDLVYELCESLLSEVAPHIGLVPIRFEKLTITVPSARVTFVGLRCDEVQLPIIQIQFVF